MGVFLRNVKTGEITEHEADSLETRELTSARYETPDGQTFPLYEQQGDHRVRRIDSGEVREDDLGADFKVPGTTLQAELGPETHPERQLTEAEKESGLESWEQKSEQLGFARSKADQRKLDQGLAKAGTADSVGASGSPLPPGGGSGQAPNSQPAQSAAATSGSSSGDQGGGGQ